MRLALPQLGVDTMPNDAGRFHDRQSEDAGADGVRPDEPHRAAVAPIIWRRMVMLRVVLAPHWCGRPRRP